MMFSEKHWSPFRGQLFMRLAQVMQGERYE